MKSVIRSLCLLLALTWLPSCTHDGQVISSAQAETVVVSQTTLPRLSNGRIDRAYPDGNDSALLVWGTCPNQQWVVGQSCAVNLRTVCSLTGTNAATAPLEKASGTLPTGCSAGTDGITGTVGATLSANQVVWRATDGAASVTAPFSVEAVAAATDDDEPPTIPTGCIATPGTGTVTIECDQSSDPYNGEAGSGVARYEIYLDGELVATKTAPALNAQPEFTTWTVGSADGTQSCTQDAADWTLSGGGAGLGSTADQFYACGQQTVGDFIATAKITGFTGATASTAGWLLRESTAAGSIYGSARARQSDAKVNNRYRSTTDASASNGTLSAAQTYPYWLRLLFSGGTVQPLVSVDGNNFSAVEAPRALSLGATPYLMFAHASGSPGTTTTSAWEQVSVAPVTRWSQAVTTSVGGAWTVKAVDASDNESAASTAIVAAPEATSCTGSSNITILHADDFEYAGGGAGGWVDISDANGGNSTLARYTKQDDFNTSVDTWPQISTNRARNGTRSMRTEVQVHNGTSWYMHGSEVAHRNEVVPKASSSDGLPSAQNTTFGGDYWYGFSVFLPDAGDANGDPEFQTLANPGYQILWQSHHGFDQPPRCSPAESGGNPPLALNYAYTDDPDTVPVNDRVRDRIQFWNYYNLAQCNYNGETVFYRYDLGSYLADRGHWTDWVIHFKPALDATGVLQVWKNGALVVNQSGPNWRNDTAGGTARFGVYQALNPPTSGGVPITPPPASWEQSVVVYHDDWKFISVAGDTGPGSTSSCAYQAVAPQGVRP